MKTKISIVLISALFLTACIGPSNEISFEKLEVGDQVGGMTVTNIDILKDEMPASASNANVTFEGEITISGAYTHRALDTAFFSDTLCVDEISSSKLPGVKDHIRTGTLCFNDKDSAQSAFESNPGEEGEVNFTISQYKWIAIGGEAVNWAELEAVNDKVVLVEGLAPELPEEDLEEEATE